MSFHVMSCPIISYHVLSCLSMSYHALSCLIMSYHVLLCQRCVSVTGRCIWEILWGTPENAFLVGLDTFLGNDFEPGATIFLLFRPFSENNRPWTEIGITCFLPTFSHVLAFGMLLCRFIWNSSFHVRQKTQENQKWMRKRRQYKMVRAISLLKVNRLLIEWLIDWLHP